MHQFLFNGDHDRLTPDLLLNIKVSMEEYDEALELLKQARDLREAAFGKNDVRVGRAYICLGMVHFLANHDNEAGDCLSEFVLICDNIKKKHLRPAAVVEMTLHLMLAHMVLGDILFNAHTAAAVDMWSRALKFSKGKDTVDPVLVDMVNRRMQLSVSKENDVVLEPEEKHWIHESVFTSVERNW